MKRFYLVDDDFLDAVTWPIKSEILTFMAILCWMPAR